MAAREPARGETKVRAYVGLVAFDALFVLLLCALAVWRAPPSWPQVAYAAPLVAGVAFLQRHPFTFRWREHRLVISLDEAAVLIGLLVLPPAVFVFAVTGAVAIAQILGGHRDPMKRVFNVTQHVLAASVGAGAFIGLTTLLHVPAVVAAAISTLPYALMASFLLAGVFGLLSDASLLTVYRERFLVQGFSSAMMGVAGGLAIVALWNLHPLATLSLVPFVYIVTQYWRLYAGADRELDVHRRLANATHDLVGTTSMQAVAERVLGEAEALLDCGRAELRVLDQSFAREFGSGPRRAADPIVAPLPSGLGELRVWSRQGKDAFGEQERALVRTMAGQAASAIENARALSRLDTYLSTAQDAVLLVDKDGTVSYLNPAARRLFGVPEGAQARASDFFDAPELLETPLVPVLVEAKARALTGGRGFLVEAHAGPVLDSDQVTGTVIVVRDVTERKRLEEEAVRQREALAQADKLSTLGTLVAGVAHEINNPLTYMAGNLQLLQLDVAERLRRPDITNEERRFLEAVAEEVRISLEGSERITHIATSLKNVARRGNAQEARRAEDLNKIVKDVAAVVRAGVTRKVKLEIDLAPSLPRVAARASEIHQVVLNLVKNAAEALASREDGWVRVSTIERGADVLLEVEDNGPGIPAEIQRNLFSPFFTTKENGTGLGLSISHRIVAAHGGEMTVESQVGRGTKFRVRLPALTPDEGAEAPARPAST